MSNSKQELGKNDIRLGLQRITAQVNKWHSIQIKPAGLPLEAELLQNEQRTIELRSGRKAYVDVIGIAYKPPVE